MNYSFKEYQANAGDFALRTSSPDADLAHWLAGVAEEAGEVAGKYKRFLRGDIDRLELRRVMEKELGDLLWYIQETATELDLSLAQIAQLNIVKLSDRRARNVLAGSGDER